MFYLVWTMTFPSSQCTSSELCRRANFSEWMNQSTLCCCSSDKSYIIYHGKQPKMFETGNCVSLWEKAWRASQSVAFVQMILVQRFKAEFWALYSQWWLRVVKSSCLMSQLLFFMAYVSSRWSVNHQIQQQLTVQCDARIRDAWRWHRF